MIVFSIPDGVEHTFEKEVIVTAVSVIPASNSLVTLEFNESYVTGLWSNKMTYLPCAIRANRFKAVGGTVRIYIPKE